MKKFLQQFYMQKNFPQRLIAVILATIFLGFFTSFIVITDLGTDPCTLFNLAVSAKLGIGIGTWQALFNTVLLIIVLFFGVTNLGFGTLANMFLVGYSIQFFSWLWSIVIPADMFTALPARIALLIPSITGFVISAAVYMDVKLGTSPFDAVPFIISSKLPNVPFKFVRITFDIIVTAIAALLGGHVMPVTIIMIFTLGPVIEFTGKHIQKFIKIE